VFGHFGVGRLTKRLFPAESEASRAALSGQMMSWWTEFARTGRPGRGRDGRLAEWTPWDDAPEAPRVMLLRTTAQGGPAMSPAREDRASILADVPRDPRLATPKARCLVWRQLVAGQRLADRQFYDGLEECRTFPFDAFPWREN
jgi:para-nitrobenzyl esterase